MDYRESSDETLMEATRAGSHAAMEVLVRRFAARLLTFLMRLTGRLHAAEDLFQETFGAVWAKRQTYQVGRAFKPWLYAIAVNKHRERGRRKAPELEHSAIPVVELGEDPPDARDRFAEARLALAKLGDRQREVVVLHLYGGLSYAQIAECLGVGETTARGYMCEALGVLRREMHVDAVKEEAR